MKITLEQVAKKLNLSTGTVSMALRNDPRIKESTRKYVLELAQKLNYVPSALGRSLATQRTQTLGLTITDISNPFFTELFKGVEDTAVKKGYSVILSNTEYDLNRETEILRIFLEGRVDGLVIDPVENNTDFIMLKQLKRMGIPFVLLRKLKGLKEEYDYVMADDRKGAFLLTQHLINLGHRRIGYIGSTKCGVTDHDRFLGYKQALAKAGIEFDASLVTSHDSFSLSEGLKVGHGLLQTRKDIDAVVAFNDLLALGVMEAAYSLGLRIPEDLAVGGFDDIYISGLSPISLTTVALPKYELGSKATELLIEKIEAKRTGRTAKRKQIVLEPKLVIRKSCGYRGGLNNQKKEKGEGQ